MIDFKHLDELDALARIDRYMSAANTPFPETIEIVEAFAVALRAIKQLQERIETLETK
ncbi:MAG: hypothetical protein WC374_05830 [Phycisphaerae bacterium]|jgi:hypothetical protein